MTDFALKLRWDVLSGQILRRAIELMHQDGIEFREAYRRATKQVAAVERLKPRTPKAAPAVTSAGAVGDAKEQLFAKILAMARRRGNVVTPIPHTPPPPVQPSDSARTPPPQSDAAPATSVKPEQSPTPPLSDREIMLAMGFCIGGASRVQFIDDEFPPHPATAGWRASLNRPPPQYEPDLTDISDDGIVRAFEEQERRRKTEGSS